MKLIDQIYQCQIPNQKIGTWELHCHLRIFSPDPEVQMVMISDTGFEMGWFIPSLVETLINRVVEEFHLNPTKVIWIESYTANIQEITQAKFSQVIVDWHNGKAKNPQWIAIAPETVKRFIIEERLSA